MNQIYSPQLPLQLLASLPAESPYEELRTQIKAIFELVATIEEVKASGVSADTHALMILQRQAQGIELQAHREKLTELLANVRREISRVHDEELAKVGAIKIKNKDLEADIYAAETRSVFRSLNAAAKTKFIDEAIARADGGAVSAITTAPAYLSGIDDDTQAAIKQQFLNILAPFINANRLIHVSNQLGFLKP